MKHFSTAVMAGLLFAYVLPIRAAADPFLELPLESLFKSEVSQMTTIGKRVQETFKVPAASYVVTEEQIRRSGATSIQEVLRLIPGIHVARASSGLWNVSTRGSGGVFRNKLQVLIDGRNVYNPTSAGVLWLAQNIALEDIERVELIRGSGAVLWGVNTVNGIINILTKNTKKTLGGLVTVGGGNEEEALSYARYGFRISDYLVGRLFTNFNQRGSLQNSEGDSRAFRAGYRLDRNSDEDVVTLQGDVVSSRRGDRGSLIDLTEGSSTLRNTETDFTGINSLARWSHYFSSKADINFQGYFDRVERNLNPDTDFSSRDKSRGRRSIYDLEVQGHYHLNDTHEIIAGLSMRYVNDSLRGDNELRFSDEDEVLRMVNAYLQDEWALLEKLSVSFGAKFTYNDFTDTEFQPGVRLAYHPTSAHQIWGAIQRAVRTPSRFERDVRLLSSPSDPNIARLTDFAELRGDRSFTTEKVTTYELGYRHKASEQLIVALSSFYYNYADLASVRLGRPEATGRFNILPLELNNGRSANAFGGEVEVSWHPLDWWDVKSSYSFYQEDNSFDTSNTNIDLIHPKHIVVLRSFINLPLNTEFDSTIRYVDTTKLRFSEPGESYTQLDLRLGWRVSNDFNLEVVGSNLLGSQKEFVSVRPGLELLETERAGYVKASWRF